MEMAAAKVSTAWGHVTRELCVATVEESSIYNQT